MFSCEDIRVKDGLIDVNNTVVDTNTVNEENAESMDSLAAIGRSPSPCASTGATSLSGRDRNRAHMTSHSTQRMEDWSTSGTMEWSDNWAQMPSNKQQSVSNRPYPTEHKPFTCYNCGRIGHMSRECSQPKRPQNRSGSKGRYADRGPQWSSSFGGDRSWADSRSDSQSSAITTKSDEKMAEINLFPTLKDYYLNKSLSDITIDINGQTLFAHKFVLSAKSEIFKEMIFGEELETEVKDEKMETTAEVLKTLELKDTNVEAFKLLLKFLYFEELDWNEKSTDTYKMAIEVLKLSIRFKINRLSTLIEKELIEMLEIENLVDFCKVCLEFDLNSLSESMKSFIQRNERNLIEKKAFISDSQEVMAKLLTSMTSQSLIIKGMKLIIESNPESDVKQFKDFIDCSKCSIEDIDVITEIGLLDDKELVKILRQKYEDLLNEYKKISPNKSI